MIKLKDIDKAEAWSDAGGILQKGRHLVKIAEATESETRNGNPQIELKFESDDGSILDWLVVTPATYGKVRQLLDAAGIKPESGEMELVVGTLVGKKLAIRVGEETDYKDPTKTRLRVQAYAPAGDFSPSAPVDNGAPSDDRDLPF